MGMTGRGGRQTASRGGKTERAEFRWEHSVKDTVERAAALRGQKVSEFLRQAALERAQRMIAEHETMVLSDAAREQFFEALRNPPPANDRLRAAIKRYRDRTDAD